MRLASQQKETEQSGIINYLKSIRDFTKGSKRLCIIAVSMELVELLLRDKNYSEALLYLLKAFLTDPLAADNYDYIIKHRRK